MSENYKEQHPLLCDELSDEENYSSEYQRRFRPLIYKGRAKAAAKGASVIITRWPEHWTSLVNFWWLAVSMFAISTFIIYHTLISLSILPPTQGRSFNSRSAYKTDNSSASAIPNIFMHVFVDNHDKVNLHEYTPHVEALAAKYTTFNFNFVIVVKDVTTDSYSLSAEEHNTNALNSIWDREKKQTKQSLGKENIHIEHVTLSKYMDASPLRKDWKRLPPQFIEFLVRAVSIWDKGGIAINPDILTAHSPDAGYFEKLKNILQFYGKGNDTKSIFPITNKEVKLNKHDKITKAKVNNIRDIIEIMEKDDSNAATQETLVEAEDTKNTIIIPNKRKLLSIQDDLIIEPTSYKNSNQPKKEANFLPKTDTQASNTTSFSKTSNSSKLSLLPLFLDFIFNDKVKFDDPTPIHGTRYRKSAMPIVYNKTITNTAISDHVDKLNSDTKMRQKYKPMIIAANGIVTDKPLTDKPHELTKVNDISGTYDKYQLTIDLRGNILATETPCHAFLGTVFSNVVHHTQEESLKDFVIAELSLFCKGLLSSCRGIDLILL